MKKWHLEGVLTPMAPRKLMLPDRGGGGGRCSPLVFHKEQKVTVYLRGLAAFLLRFF